MNTRKNIYVEYMLHTAKEDVANPTFLSILEGYRNRPFDDMPVVLAKMSTEQQQEFSDLWDAQLAQLQATKAELQFTLPLNPSNITSVVEGLINKLKVLAAPFITTLKLQLEQEGWVIKPQDETLLCRHAEGYVFHLLMNKKSLKDIVLKKEAREQLKIHHEFYRLLRESTFEENPMLSFMEGIVKKFKGLGKLNEDNYLTYQGILGNHHPDLERAFLMGLQAQVETLGIYEPITIRNKVLPLIADEKIKAEIENELSVACLEYINDNCKLESANRLFKFIDDNEVKGDPDFIRDIKEKALIGLCSTAIEDKQFSSNDAQVEFIQRILTAAETIGSQEKIKNILLPALRDTVNEKLNPAAINPFSKVRNAIKLFDHVSSAANEQQIQTPPSLLLKQN